MSTSDSWSDPSGRLLHEAIKCDGAVISVDCTPSGHTLVAGAVDRHAYVFGQRGAELMARVELSDEVWAVAVDDSGTTFVAGTASKRPSKGSLLCFNDRGESLYGPVDFEAPVWAVSISARGTYIAATTWAGHVHTWIRRGKRYVPHWTYHEALVSAGAYGVRVSEEGKLVAALYDTGVLVADLRHPDVDRELIRLSSGLYNISKIHSNVAFVGRRSGDFCAVDLRQVNRRRAPLEFFEPVSDRPICGVAATALGEPVFLGGFDGVLRAVDRAGNPLWAYSTPSEIWSVASSHDGATVFAGCGDEHIHVIHNPCGAAEVRELRAAEEALERSLTVDELHRYASVVIRMRTFPRAYRTVARVIDKNQLPRTDLVDVVMRLATSAPEPNDSLAGAQLLADLGSHQSAIEVLQRLIDHPEIEADSLRLMAECFDALELKEAARSAYRRVAFTRPDRDGVRLHYDLARSYEDQGQASRAREHYEFLLSWDVSYRDAYRRFQNLAANREPRRGAFEQRLDYTGLTVSMLGPDVPRDKEVDPVLLPVIKARRAESRVPPGEGTRALSALDVMAEAAAFHRAEAADLAYEVQDYLRYERAEPQDTVKKHLEMMNLLTAIDTEEISKSLDIGTATCRYPAFLERLGVDASGVDLTADGYDYMRNTRKDFTFSSFVKGNGLGLPVRTTSVDLVTCMMGTFNHIPQEDRSSLLAEACRVLEFGGLAAFGVWDQACAFQSFLTMYSDAERQMLRENGIRQREFADAARSVGFAHVTTVPFACFPDRLVYDLGLHQVGRHEMERLAAVDFGVRGRHPDWPGQMFLALCRK